MKSMPAMRLLAVVAIVCAAAIVAVALYAFAGKIPDEIEAVGPFEIVTHTHRYTAGYNEGNIRRARTENYSLRYRGKKVVVDGRAGLFTDETARYETFNAVITFPSAEPAIVVNVGDPNNRSFFYLVREKGGAESIEYLGETSGGVAVDWLDPSADASPRDRAPAVHRLHLEGGHLLLLGSFCVLDTSTLKSWRFDRHAGAWVNDFALPIGLSPDRTSFVRYGTGPAPANAPCLIVFDFVANRSYDIPIDRRVMRYAAWEEIDPTWLDHYFEWQHAKGAHDRLAPREDVKPLPYRGRLTVDPYDAYHEYRVQPVRSEMAGQVVDFLTREMKGTVLPREQYATYDVVAIDGRKVHVFFHDDYVGVWMDRGTDTSFVEEIAKRFDDALRSGKYDGYFLP